MNKKRFFRKRIIDFLQFSLIENKRVLIIGGDIGEEAVRFKPSYSVELFNAAGSDIDENPSGKPDNIVFLKKRIVDFESKEPFDYIIFCESLNYEENLYNVFNALRTLMHRDSKVFILEFNPYILFARQVLKRLGFRALKPERNILFLEDLRDLIDIFGFDIIDKGYRFAIPSKFFGLGDIIDSLLPRTMLLRRLCFGQYVIFRLHPFEKQKQKLSCSVVVPCYNEEGNIRECVSRIPVFGLWREIIIVDDGSTDKTAQIAREIAGQRDDVRLISCGQNRGKGYALKLGLRESKGDVLMMLDCDSTTPPEELVFFHDAMENGAEFINGTRVIYPRERKSSPLLNRVGVFFFANLISWVVQKRITDTFCGTKVFLKKHRDCFDIKEYLWGDLDFFFLAARYRMKMLELPVHHKARKSGESKMKPIKHGLILLLRSIEGLKIVK